MRLARSGVGAVVLENGNVIDAMVEAERVVALLIDAQDRGKSSSLSSAMHARMVGTVDNDLVKSKAVDAAAQMLEIARGLRIASK